MFDLTKSGWDSLSTDHFGCLIWLEDLDTSDYNQLELANRIHEQWDRADEQKEMFTTLDCQRTALTFWSCVREVEYTMGGSGENKKDKNNENNENNKPKKKGIDEARRRSRVSRLGMWLMLWLLLW